MGGQPEEQVVRSADGTRIGFVTLGTGPSLVLVHGGVGTVDQWLPVAKALAGRFTCHLLDRRGRGRSGDAAEHSLVREVEDIEAVLRVAGPAAHLLGHSYGAICALQAACRVPVGRLVLYEPPLPVGGPIAETVVEGVRAAVANRQLDEALALFLRGGVQMPEAELSAFRETALWKEMAALTPTLMRELEAINRLGPSLERYRKLSVETLLLLGTVTPTHLEVASRALEEALPKVRTVLLDGQSHAANLTAPDLVAREVTDFLLSEL